MSRQVFNSHQIRLQVSSFLLLTLRSKSSFWIRFKAWSHRKRTNQYRRNFHLLSSNMMIVFTLMRCKIKSYLHHSDTSRLTYHKDIGLRLLVARYGKNKKVLLFQMQTLKQLRGGSLLLGVHKNNLVNLIM